MTETQNTQYTIDEENDSQVLQWYKKLMNQIGAIDEQVDAGSEAAGKRKFKNDLMQEFESEWKPVTNALIPQLQEADERTRAGAFYGIIRSLSMMLQEEVDKWIETQVEAQPKPENAETVSDEQKKALMKERTELVKQVKTIVEMAQTFGEVSPDNPWTLPRRRGAVGSRGKRALSLYTWTVNGEEMDEDNDSPKGVSEKLGFAKVSDFTQALKDAGINTTSPEDEFTVTIKEQTVSASKALDEEVDETEAVTAE